MKHTFPDKIIPVNLLCEEFDLELNGTFFHTKNLTPTGPSDDEFVIFNNVIWCVVSGGSQHTPAEKVDLTSDFTITSIHNSESKVTPTTYKIKAEHGKIISVKLLSDQ